MAGCMAVGVQDRVPSNGSSFFEFIQHSTHGFFSATGIAAHVGARPESGRWARGLSTHPSNFIRGFCKGQHDLLLAGRAGNLLAGHFRRVLQVLATQAAHALRIRLDGGRYDRPRGRAGPGLLTVVGCDGGNAGNKPAYQKEDDGQWRKDEDE